VKVTITVERPDGITRQGEMAVSDTLSTRSRMQVGSLYAWLFEQAMQLPPEK
jgi:hypothetical protein